MKLSRRMLRTLRLSAGITLLIVAAAWIATFSRTVGYVSRARIVFEVCNGVASLSLYKPGKTGFPFGAFVRDVSPGEIGFRMPAVSGERFFWYWSLSVPLWLPAVLLIGLLLAVARKREALRAGEARCISCDYLLTGVASERCPECGTPRPKTQL